VAHAVIDPLPIRNDLEIVEGVSVLLDELG